MQLSSRILTALAVLILAVAVLSVRAGDTETVEAATGTIDVLNVGTCYTTSTDVFAVGACKDGVVDDTDGDGVLGDGTTGSTNPDSDDSDSAYNVGTRDKISKVPSVYATYAIDPKWQGDAPRAIIKNSDLIKISILDTGRDKRTGVLFGTTGNNDPTTAQTGDITKALGSSLSEDLKMDDNDTPNDATDDHLNLTGTEKFTGSGVASITSSGNYELLHAATDHPMALDGKVYWFGVFDGDGAGTTFQADFISLAQYVELDEDRSSGTHGTVAPWMQVKVSMPTGATMSIQYVYYQTSEQEELIGGAFEDDIEGDNPMKSVYKQPPDYTGTKKAEPPKFVDKEASANAPLVVQVGADGVARSQNLWLKESGRFTGRYEGYVRLTDTNGDGRCETTDANDKPTVVRCNWGLLARDASGPGMDDGDSDGMNDYAVLGVQTGPVVVTYKNSKGDTKTLNIMIDAEPPAIQIDAPLNKTSSKDDSPELLGSFTDGGGSGLRDESFKIYADNRNEDADTPIWDLAVTGTAPTAPTDLGYVCADVNVDATPTADGCETDGVVQLRTQHYSGYQHANHTFGIVRNDQVYLSDADGSDSDTADDYKIRDAEDYDDGDLTGTFDTVARIDFPPDEEDDNRYNDTIDIQAVVMDIAGNVGFSDSMPNEPTFIHDIGTKIADRDKVTDHNVLGWYSRHLYYLDDVDPKFSEDESASGFYLDEDNKQTASNMATMVDFDGALDPATVGVGTFKVTLDDGSEAVVTEVKVKDDKVYLMLDTELAPNATPKVELAAGQTIADLAGNESNDRRLKGIELSDGISPTFTVTLDGGSGLYPDLAGQGPSDLTKDQITITISSNEKIQGAPRFTVVCNGLAWGTGDKAGDNNVTKFANDRNGALTKTPNLDGIPAKGADGQSVCGETYFAIQETKADRRPGNNWEYQWDNLAGDSKLADGKLSIIVWGRDTSNYKQGSGATAKTVHNYASETVGFTLDTKLKAAWDSDAVAGELIPAAGDNVFEPRPFVLLDFGDEKTKVAVSKFTVDGTDHTADLQVLEGNEFVWWPEPLSYGEYTVVVEANDAANNTGDYTYKFNVKERAPFVLNLLAGWNSVSFPANPVDRALHAVFTEADVDQVVGWNVTDPVSPWRMATRVDGVWTTGDEYATLNDVEARYGYWVHSKGFITQAVKLAGSRDRSMDGQPNPADIPTAMGWNFVGVVDVDGDQTQDDAGETLRNSDNDPITAGEYLGNYLRAYTWDHVNNTWDVLKSEEGIVIGTGVWVYYGTGVAP